METCKRLLQTRGVRWAGAALVALFALLWLAVPDVTRAENERVITIYHDDIQQTVVTSAETVEEVLQRAEIPLGEKDAVEPARDTQLVAPAYNINIYRARPIIVIDGAKRYPILSPHTSAHKIAEAAGLKVYAEDDFDLTRIDNFLEGGVGLQLTIHRSTPLTFVLYGNKSEIRTQAKTVEELLQEKEVALAPEDGVSPGLSTPITAGMTIAVYRNGIQTITEEQEVDFPVEHIQDGDREVGYREISKPGVKGRKVVTYHIELRNGKEVGRKEIQSVVTVQSKAQVEIVGIKTVGFDGDFAAALAALRACEAGGNYANKKNPVYRGAYQFGYPTWANYAGYSDPADAPPPVQDQAARELYLRRGWQPWPACSQNLGLQDIYR